MKNEQIETIEKKRITKLEKRTFGTKDKYKFLRILETDIIK